jgi:hypothetical protein
MQEKFNSIIETIKPFLTKNGYIQNRNYFYKNQDNFKFNFNFEVVDDSEENFKFYIQCCIYYKHFQEILKLNQEEFPKGFFNFFYKTQDQFNPKLDGVILLSKEIKPEIIVSEIEISLQNAIDLFAKVTDKNTLVDLSLEHDLLTNYDNRFRYFIECNDAYYITKYAELITEKVKDDAYQTAFFKKELLRVANIGTLAEKFKANFPSKFPIPKALKLVCDWADKNERKTISGLFEFDDNGKKTISYWITDKKIAKQFAVFGQTADLDMFCIWKHENGTFPIVRIGNGGSANVLAASMDDFIDLLAINYYEVEVSDLTIEPVYDSEEAKKNFENTEFRKFYTETFKKEIQKTGKDIVAKVIDTKEIYTWLCANYQPWNEF